MVYWCANGTTLARFYLPAISYAPAWPLPLCPVPTPTLLSSTPPPSLYPPSQGTVEKQQSVFFMITVSEAMARDGLVLRCLSTNKSRFKLVVSLSLTTTS